MLNPQDASNARVDRREPLASTSRAIAKKAPRATPPTVGAVAAGLALSAAGLLVAGCSPEQEESQYISLSAARIAGAVHEGWIPEWLPKKAHNIKEKHDSERKTSIARFTFPASDPWSPPSSCPRVAAAGARAPSLTATWWPADVPPASAAAPRHAYYACADAREFLAVDFPGGEGFYWRP